MRRFLLALVIALAVVAPAGAWTWPADGPVLQPFSFDPEVPKAPGHHRGIDVAGPIGAVVRAPATGVISFAGVVPSNGKCVTIETADGWSVTLTHLGSIAVTKGASVVEGDGVGTIGPSDEPGVSDPHVHLGIRRTSDEYGYVDPAAMLPLRPSSVVEPGAVAASTRGDRGRPCGDGRDAAHRARLRGGAGSGRARSVDARHVRRARRRASRRRRTRRLPPTSLRAPSGLPAAPEPQAAEPATATTRALEPAPAASAGRGARGARPVPTPALAPCSRRRAGRGQRRRTPLRARGATAGGAPAPRPRRSRRSRNRRGRRRRGDPAGRALRARPAAVGRAAVSGPGGRRRGGRGAIGRPARRPATARRTARRAKLDPRDAARERRAAGAERVAAVRRGRCGAVAGRRRPWRSDRAHVASVGRLSQRHARRRRDLDRRAARAARTARLLRAGSRASSRRRRRPLRRPPRIIDLHVGWGEEDPGGACVAVRRGPQAPRSRRGLRRPVRRLRPLSPAQGQRRAHGQRDGRARHAGDGRGGSRREVLR